MQNKFHNRTIFVAALSVYLGLLVVGAPPQVLAQTTAIVRNEIKQNDKDLTGENLPDFAETVRLFINEANKFPFQPVKVTANYTFALGCEQSNFNVKPTDFTRLGSKIVNVGNKFVDGLIGSGAFTYVYKGKQISDLTVVLEINDSELNSKAKFLQSSDGDAQKFVSLYKTAWENWKTQEQNLPEAVIYENTEIFADNNQVFIVTRLPRGSLDSLLKADEKAN